MPGPGDLETSTLPDNLAGDTGMDLNDDVEINLTGQEEDSFFAPDKPEPDRQDPDPAPGDADLENDTVAQVAATERRLRAEYERKSAQARAEHEEQIFKSEKKNLETQRDAFKLSLDGVDVRIETATEALKLARTDGDAGSETEIEQRLNELRRVRGQIENNQSQLPSDDQLDEAYKQHVSKRQAAVASEGVKPLNDKAGRWADSNAGWFNKDPEAMKTLSAINNSLVQEGFKPEDDSFFSELSARMTRVFPTLGIRGVQPRADNGRFAQRPASSPPVASVRSTAPVSPDPKQQRQNRNRVDLDGGDRRMMKMLGIDLSNKDAVQRFAREKLMRERREAR